MFDRPVGWLSFKDTDRRYIIEFPHSAQTGYPVSKLASKMMCNCFNYKNRSIQTILPLLFEMQALSLSLKLSGIQFSQFQIGGVCCGPLLAHCYKSSDMSTIISEETLIPIIYFFHWPLGQETFQYVYGKDAQQSKLTFLKDPQN